MSELAVSAVVIAYEPGIETADCLRALCQLDLDEVVVWDNSVHSGSILNLKNEFASVHFYGDMTNDGFGAGNNRAIRKLASNPDYVLLVNPDCVVGPAALTQLLDTIQSDPQIALVAPRMRYPDQTYGIAGGSSPSLFKEILAWTRIDDLLPQALRELAIGMFSRIASPRGQMSYAESMDGDGAIDLMWVSGFCMLVDLKKFAEVNGFDERFFLYFEDVDLCKRLNDRGYRIVLQRDAEAIHFESSTTESTGSKSKFYWGGLRTYFLAHGRPAQRVAARLLTRAAR